MHRLKLCRSGNYGCGCSRNNRCRHDNNRVNRRERNSNGKMRTSNLNRLLRHTAPHRFLLLCLPFTASCSEGSVPEPCAELPTRTVLVYLAGDNNLEEIGRTPELLRQGWKDTGSKCLIYYDAPQAAPKLFALTIRHSDASSVLETVEEYPEENSSSAGVFGRVLADVVRKYPSDSYGLIFASHGSGWLPCGALSDPTRTIGDDRTPGTTGGAREMEITDFAAAIPDHQFDFIIFEACLMSGIEVAYELRNKTDYLLASSAELLVPGYAPVYPTAFQYLFDTNLGVPQALEKFAGSYFNYIDTRNGAYRSATQSIVYTREMDALAILAGKTTGNTHGRWDDALLGKLQHFDRPGSYGDIPARPRYFDFGQYMAYLAPERQADLDALLRKTVVWKAATPEFMAGYNGFTILTHSGLTTYIEQDEFPELNAAYKKTAWWKATHVQK